MLHQFGIHRGNNKQIASIIKKDVINEKPIGYKYLNFSNRPPS